MAVCNRWNLLGFEDIKSGKIVQTFQKKMLPPSRKPTRIIGEDVSSETPVKI
jgi:hypothetical protein